MKKAKSLISVILALMLVFTMALTSFAAGEGSITITNAVKNQTYSVYKMFSLVPGQAPGESYVYTAEGAWASFLELGGKDYLAIEDGTIVWVGDETAERKAELAKAALAYAEKNGISPVDTQVAEGTTVEFTDLDLGYYLIDSSLGALCSLTSTNPTAKVEEKNDQPKVEKTVKEDSTGEYGESNTASIGDTVEFKTVITAQSGAQNYVLHDKMEAGLTFDASSVVVTYGDSTLVAGTDYTLTVPGTETVAANKCTFEIDFSDDFEATLGDDDTIVVTYSAVLNENAEIYTDTNDNETWLKYGDENETTKSKTETKAFSFDLVKTDENDTIIDGAEVRLYSAEAGTQEVAVIYDELKGYYRPVVDGETGTVITAGNVTISGLDSDMSTVYYLKETQAPSGYNMLTNPITVDLKDTDGNAVNLTATTDGTSWTEGGIHVINDSGSLLPETGGIGTVIIYVIGGLLVAGAIVLFITKKKASSTEA